MTFAQWYKREADKDLATRESDLQLFRSLSIFQLVGGGILFVVSIVLPTVGSLVYLQSVFGMAVLSIPLAHSTLVVFWFRTFPRGRGLLWYGPGGWYPIDRCLAMLFATSLFLIFGIVMNILQHE